MWFPAPFTPAYKQIDLFIPQSDRDQTYTKLIEDLKTATDLVPWRTKAGIRSYQRSGKSITGQIGDVQRRLCTSQQR